MVSKSDTSARFTSFAGKAIICHTVTYFVAGLLAAHFLNYAAILASPESGMRPITDRWVMAGPLLQPIRGLIFALVFYPLRACLFGHRDGWLLMGWVLVALGILSTFAAAPGSIEGMIYLKAGIIDQLKGWLEVVPQALLFSALLWYWVKHPAKWLNWLLGIAFFVTLALPLLGLLTSR